MRRSFIRASLSFLAVILLASCANQSPSVLPAAGIRSALSAAPASDPLGGATQQSTAAIVVHTKYGDYPLAIGDRLSRKVDSHGIAMLSMASKGSELMIELSSVTSITSASSKKTTFAVASIPIRLRPDDDIAIISSGTTKNPQAFTYRWIRQ